MGHTSSQGLEIRRFLALPKCIMTELCGWLHPRDLLALGRATRQLRSVFMSRESAPHWLASRQPLGLPRWPSISEPAYATLIFETTCQSAGCTSTSDLTCDAIFVRGRFCKRCAKVQLLSRDEIQLFLPDLPISLVSQLPTSKHRVNMDYTSETGLFHTRTDVLKLWSIFKASCSQEYTKHSLVQRLLPDLKAAKKANSIIADQVWAWIRRDDARKRRKIHPTFSELSGRLQRRGWEKKDYPTSNGDWVHLINNVFNSPPRNDEGWRKTIRSFEKILYAHKGKAGQPTKNARPFALSPKESPFPR